jgi:GT2 family glycosyltransferase
MKYSIDEPIKKSCIEVNVKISGWFFDDNHEPAQKIFIRIGDRIINSEQYYRPDIAKVYPKARLEASYGFHATFKTGSGLKRISVFALSKSGEKYRIFDNIYLTHKNNFKSAQESAHDSPATFDSIQNIVKYRNSISPKNTIKPIHPNELPFVDVSVVAYNNGTQANKFTKSIIESSYPANKLKVLFHDNNSNDSTYKQLEESVELLKNAGISCTLTKSKNGGFGYGHNRAIKCGNAPLILISNIDLAFTTTAIETCVTASSTEIDDKVAAWEFAQRPYEHPKYYDPVSLVTNWNSHACILIKRTAFNQIGGYDENIFLYAEDVEFSYRLRRNQHLLKYVPRAIVWHDTYTQANETKPAQYTGSITGNIYLRLKHGGIKDILKIPGKISSILKAKEPLPFSKKTILKIIAKKTFPCYTQAILYNLLKRKTQEFNFLGWDYEPIRLGAFHEKKIPAINQPMVTIITRTYKGREKFLEQAIASVHNQTWTNIEHIVVEDGGESMSDLVKNAPIRFGAVRRFISAPKRGRSFAANLALAQANGTWCMFLDDDDLLFSDHVEVLADSLLTSKHKAAYTIAWEVITDSSSAAYLEMCYKINAEHLKPFSIDRLKTVNFIPIQSVLFDKNLYTKYGGLQEGLDSLEDWLFWLKIAQAGDFLFLPVVTSMYRTPYELKLRVNRQVSLNDSEAFVRKQAATFNYEGH